MWVLVVVPGVLVVIVAPIVELNTWTNLGVFKDLGYIIGLGCLVVFTFYGIWAYERAFRQQPGAIAMRDAIAATVILLYLVLLSWAVFFGPGDLNVIAAELLKSFTALVSVVVAFYFSSVTVDQVLRSRKPTEHDPGKLEDEDPSPPQS
jgi:hypothetical protein